MKKKYLIIIIIGIVLIGCGVLICFNKIDSNTETKEEKQNLLSDLHTTDGLKITDLQINETSEEGIYEIKFNFYNTDDVDKENLILLIEFKNEGGEYVTDESFTVTEISALGSQEIVLTSEKENLLDAYDYIFYEYVPYGVG